MRVVQSMYVIDETNTEIIGNKSRNVAKHRIRRRNLDWIIYIFRFVVVMFCIVFISYAFIKMLIIYFRYHNKEPQTFYDAKFAFVQDLYFNFTLYNFILIPIVLTLLIINLICMLHFKQRKLSGAGFSNVFSRENRNMLFILIVFDTSIAARVIVNQIFYSVYWYDDKCTDENGHEYLCITFVYIMKNLIEQYFWDYIPIMMILIFHRQNFKPIDDIDVTVNPLEESQHLMDFREED